MEYALVPRSQEGKVLTLGRSAQYLTIGKVNSNVTLRRNSIDLDHKYGTLQKTHQGNWNIEDTSPSQTSIYVNNSKLCNNKRLLMVGDTVTFGNRRIGQLYWFRECVVANITDYVVANTEELQRKVLHLEEDMARFRETYLLLQPKTQQMLQITQQLQGTDPQLQKSCPKPEASSMQLQKNKTKKRNKKKPNQKLQGENYELKDENFELELENYELRRENQQLRDENQKLQDKNYDLKIEKKGLRNVCNELQDEKEELQDLAQQLQTQVLQLQETAGQ